MLSLRTTLLKVSNKVVVLSLVSMTSKAIWLLSSQIPDFCLFREIWSWKRRGPGISSHERMAHLLLPWAPREKPAPVLYLQVVLRWQRGSLGHIWWAQSFETAAGASAHGWHPKPLGDLAGWEVQDNNWTCTSELTLSLARQFSGLVAEKEAKFHAWEGQVSLVLMPMTAPFKGTIGNTKPATAGRGDKAALVCDTRLWTRKSTLF